MSVEVLSATTGNALGAGDLVTFSYPTGRTAASYERQGARLDGTSITARQAEGDFSVIYGSAAVTVAYRSGPSIPAGTVELRCPVASGYKIGVSATESGTSLGAETTDKISLYGVTPIVQRVGAAQAAVSATVGSAVATTAATDTTPFGYAEAQANALVTNINTLRVDVLALTTLVNELRASLVVLGAIKGAA